MIFQGFPVASYNKSQFRFLFFMLVHQKALQTTVYCPLHPLPNLLAAGPCSLLLLPLGAQIILPRDAFPFIFISSRSCLLQKRSFAMTCSKRDPLLANTVPQYTSMWTVVLQLLEWMVPCWSTNVITISLWPWYLRSGFRTGRHGFESWLHS